MSVVSRASLKWSLSATQAQLWTAHSVALCSPVAGGDCRPGVKDARRPRILLFPPVRAAVSLSHHGALTLGRFTTKQIFVHIGLNSIKC